MSSVPSRDRLDGPWARAMSAPAVRAVLAENRIVRGLHHVNEVGSTQDELRSLAVAGAQAGDVLIVDHQRSGRGRSGNRWDDDRSGGSLAMSLLIHTTTPPLDPQSVPLLPHALGLAVVSAIAALGPRRESTRLRLKWPNDVIQRLTSEAPPRKLAGVLVERERITTGGGSRDVLVCGVGLNVALTGHVPPDRMDLATLLGARPDPAVLLAALLKEIDVTLRALVMPAEVMDRARALSDTIGRRIRISVHGEEPFVGVATGIDPGGRLLVDVGGRVRAIISGTIRDADGADDVRTDDERRWM